MIRRGWILAAPLMALVASCTALVEAGKPPKPPRPPKQTTTTTEVTTTTTVEPTTTIAVTTTTPVETTTTQAEVCVDPATVIRSDVHGDVTVHYAVGPNGPYPVGWSGADGCIHPY